jgi:hypothetical protein
MQKGPPNRFGGPFSLCLKKRAQIAHTKTPLNRAAFL